MDHRPRRPRSAQRTAAAAACLALMAAGCGSHGSSAAGAGSSSGPLKIGVALTYNSTAFWASYAASKGVQPVSVDTIVGVGHVYMVVRASNTLYGRGSCAYISSKAASGYVLDLEGDLASSNGADRSNAFEQCMAQNDPGVKVLKEPTNWTEATAVSDAQNAVNAYGSQLKAIYAQWSSPDTGVIPLLQSKVGAASGVILLGLAQNVIDLAQVSNYWQLAISGVVILFALVLARVVAGEASAE